MNRSTTRRITADLSRLEAFNTSGALQGRPVAHAPDAGRLYGVGWREMIRHDEPDYVIWSYATPIAWHGKRGWIIPDVRYSVTTSKHQSAARVALSGNYASPTSPEMETS